MKLATGVLIVGAVSAGGFGAAHVAKHDSPAPVRAPVRVVSSVELDGPSLPTATLRSALQTRIGSPVDAVALSADRTKLNDILVERGYLAAMVGPAQVRWCDHGAHVRFAVAPGGEYRVREVRVSGSSAEGAVSAPTVRAGETVSIERVSRGAELVAGWLAEHGAPGSTVTYHLDVDHENLQADVVYDVHRPRIAWR